MVILIAGASHTGKTALAQKLLVKYGFPYLSIDHLKMGLIRSKNTTLTPTSDDKELTSYLWPIVSEIIKTAIENEQNLIIEGCYIPFDFAESFNAQYLKNIDCRFLVMSEKYIDNHFDDIVKYESIIERRISDSDFNAKSLIEENKNILRECISRGLNYILIDESYDVDIEISIS